MATLRWWTVDWIVLMVFTVQAVNGSLYRIKPQSSAVLQGRTVTLRCAYNNLQRDEVVIWQGPPGDKVISTGRNVMKSFTRHRITGDPSRGEYNLEIHRARMTDNGKYSCYTDPATAAEDATLTVIVPMSGPPTITGGELVTTAGAQLTLTCRSSGGHPPPRLTWINGTQPFRSASDSVGKETELFIPRLTKWDNGANFTCLADQGFPELSKPKALSRILRVQYPPQVQVPSPSVHVREGEPASLSCMVDSNPKATVKWRKLGDTFPILAVRRDHVLQLPKVTKHDGGQYQCEADNGVPPVGLGAVTLQVYYPPVIEDTMENEVTMLYGQDNLLVDCVADGNPKPHIRWRRKDTSLYWDNPLRFHRVRYDVQGTYQCVAASDGFQEVTKDVYVNVVGRPSITGGITTLAAAEGSNARLHCEILGDPLPSTVTWFWQTEQGVENVVMPTDPGVIITEETTDSGIASSLVVEEVGISREGTYICQASNMFGEARREIRLEVTVIQKSKRDTNTTNSSHDSQVVISVTMATLVLGIAGAIIVCVAFKKKWICREQKPDTSTLSSTRSMPPIPKSVKRLGHGTNDSGVEDLELQELDGTLKPRPPPRAGKKEWKSVGLSYTGLAHSNTLPPYSTVERHRPDGEDIRSRGGIPEEAVTDDIECIVTPDDPPAPPPKDKKRRWKRRATPSDVTVSSSLHEAENVLNEIQADSI